MPPQRAVHGVTGGSYAYRMRQIPKRLCSRVESCIGARVSVEFAPLEKDVPLSTSTSGGDSDEKKSTIEVRAEVGCLWTMTKNQAGTKKGTLP